MRAEMEGTWRDSFNEDTIPKQMPAVSLCMCEMLCVTACERESMQSSCCYELITGTDLKSLVVMIEMMVMMMIT